MLKLVGSGKSTTITSKLSRVSSSHLKASVLTTLTFGDASAWPLSPASVGFCVNSVVMAGSSSTRVMLSHAGVLEDLAHRHAVAAAQHRHLLRRAAAEVKAAIAGCTSASW